MFWKKVGSDATYMHLEGQNMYNYSLWAFDILHVSDRNDHMSRCQNRNGLLFWFTVSPDPSPESNCGWKGTPPPACWVDPPMWATPWWFPPKKLDWPIPVPNKKGSASGFPIRDPDCTIPTPPQRGFKVSPICGLTYADCNIPDPEHGGATWAAWSILNPEWDTPVKWDGSWKGGVSLGGLAAPKVVEGAPKEGARVEPKGLPYGADVSGRGTPATAPDLTTGPDVKPLALKAPGKLGGVTGGWRNEGEEGGIYSFKYPSREKMHQSRERVEKRTSAG